MWGFYFIKIFIKSMNIKNFEKKLNEFFKFGKIKIIDDQPKFFKEVIKNQNEIKRKK